VLDRHIIVPSVHKASTTEGTEGHRGTPTLSHRTPPFLLIHAPIYKMHAMEQGSKRAAENGAWIRWLMPSAADLIFIGIFSALVFTPLSVRLLGDAGIGWHIRTGQQILATHAIPRVDWFSSTMSGKPWFAWEWVYDAVAGKLEAAAGLNGVVWFTAIVIATVFSWLFRALLARGANLLAAVVFMLLASAASTIHFLARPHVLSWLFGLAWFLILDSAEEWRSAQGRLWSLPVLMVVWVNVHGGFLLGFALLGIFWLSSLWTWLKSRRGPAEDSAARRRVRDLLAVGVAAALASLINPYGWRLHAHIYAYLSDRFLMEHIDEFQSPNFHGVAQKCFLVLLLFSLSVLLILIRGRQLRPSQGLLALFAVSTALYATRNIPVSSILLALIAGPLISDLGFAPDFFRRMTQVESSLRGHLWAIVAVAVTGGMAILGSPLLAKPARSGASQFNGTSAFKLMDAHFDAKRMPVDAVNYLHDRHAEGPVFCPDNWGGYLIYRAYPSIRVVVDDRHDLYGPEFLKSYLRLIHVEPGWEDFLREHSAAWLVVPHSSALANALTQSAGWRSVYADETAIVFEPAQRLPNK